VTAAASTLLCLVAWRSVPAEPPLGASGAPGDAPASGQVVIATPAILAIGGIAIGLESILTGLGPTALIATGLSEARAAGLLSGFFVCFLSARLSLLWLASRVAPPRLLAAALMLTLIFAIGATLSPALFFVLCGIPAGIYFPSYFVTATARLGPSAHAAPVIIVAGMAGGVAAPLIAGGAMAVAAGPGPAFFLTVAAGALVSLVLALQGLRGAAAVAAARRA
jgi:MFS transporter, FHS family, glucose/mannose:H+ symporter